MRNGSTEDEITSGDLLSVGLAASGFAGFSMLLQIGFGDDAVMVDAKKHPDAFVISNLAENLHWILDLQSTLIVPLPLEQHMALDVLAGEAMKSIDTRIADLLAEVGPTDPLDGILAEMNSIFEQNDAVMAKDGIPPDFFEMFNLGEIDKDAVTLDNDTGDVIDISTSRAEAVFAGRQHTERVAEHV